MAARRRPASARLRFVSSPRGVPSALPDHVQFVALTETLQVPRDNIFIVGCLGLAGLDSDDERLRGRAQSNITLAMVEDIALRSYRHGWFSINKLKFIYRELLIAAHRDTGQYKIPS
jgi:hypothetical protein